MPVRLSFNNIPSSTDVNVIANPPDETLHVLLWTTVQKIMQVFVNILPSPDSLETLRHLELLEVCCFKPVPLAVATKYSLWAFLGVWSDQLTSARRKTVFPIDLVAGGFREGNDAFQLHQPYGVTWLAWWVHSWLGVLGGVLKHDWTSDFYVEVGGKYM